MDPASIATQTEATRDPWDRLMYAGSDPEMWTLLVGPVGLLLLVVLLVGIGVVFKRRKEGADLRRDVEISEDPKVIPMPFRERQLELPKEYVADVEEGQKESLTLVQKPKEIQKESGVSLSWRERLFQGLSRTRDAFQSNLKSLFSTTSPLTDDHMEKLHEVLFRADLGVHVVDKILEGVKKDPLLKGGDCTWELVSSSIKRELNRIMEPLPASDLKGTEGPLVLLVVGVNGAGKTTTIGKLAHYLKSLEKKVLIVAGDTFRAAAIDQLKVWADRAQVEIVKSTQGADPAAIAFDGVKAAIARKMDVVIIDTAGRLQAKKELMEELAKIYKVLGRECPGAPHETLLVLDATTGQNALSQVKAFGDVAKVTGLVLTKLDGTAKGGVLFSIADEFKLPIKFIGVGEKMSDLRPFKAQDFIDALF